ncbi:hypothetical protein [Viscerimonas tarda]
MNGALFMFGVVLLIAFVGGIYFVIQDHKNSHHSDSNSDKD